MTAEGVASYRASKAREKVSREAGTGYYKTHGGGGGGRATPTTTARGEKVTYYYNPSTGKATYWVGSGKPSGSGWQDIGSTKPAGWVGGQARGVATSVDRGDPRIQQLISTGKYYYDPVTRVATTRKVEGQTGMTKGEVLRVIKTLPRQAKAEYGEKFRQYSTAKKDVQRAELSALAGPITQRGIPTLATAISYGKPSPTFLGGLGLALIKGRKIVTKVKKKYDEYTPPGLVPVTKTAVSFSRQLSRKLKFKEAKEVGIKAKEKVSDVVVKHPLVYDVKQFIGLIPKSFKWAKKEFGPEIKTEAQRFKGIRDWNKDMDKMTGVFLKAREGYVWAESKAKEWKPGPIVKQPTFLKGVDPYKGFREQTKEQVVGAAQIGKVTMGATAGIVEDIKVKPYKLPLIYAAGVVAGPVATKVIGTGKFAKVAGIGFGTAFAAGVGVQTAVTPAGLEREKLIGVRAAELTAFLSGAKYGIEKKPLAELYKARVRGPRFERQIDKWQKGITAKDWTYLEKRAFIPIKKMPQRTLYGEPIKPTEIRIAKKAAGLDPGFYGMDIARYRVTGYDTKFSQKLVTDVYKLKTIGYTKPKLFKLPKPIKKVTAIITKPIKVIDWRQQKVIDLSPKKMDSITRQMLTAEPMRFTVIDKPPIKLPLYQRVEALRLKEIPKWPEFQKQLFWVKSKVTKIDRPFYIGKPKLPKPVKLGIPKSTAPVHVKPIPKPVKIKPTEAMPGVSVRPVYAAPPKPTAPADVGEVFGTIPGGRALAGTLILSGIKHKDWTSALSRQFGESRRKQQQKQNAKLAILLDQPTKQEEEQTPKQAPKLSQYLKQIPKQIPEQIPKQIPKQTPRVVTIPKIIQIPEIIPIPPYIPPPYIPQPKKPEPPLPLIPLPFIFPKIKYGVPKKKKKKKKKFKPTYKYTPSLFAVSKKITTKQIPMPKYLTGVGIRPIKLKF